MTEEKTLCENCHEREVMETTPLCEVCRDEMEDRYAENESTYQIQISGR
jgi:hypothetical protein